jgi:DNA-binding GntR family transcriptional regulator
MRKHVLQPRKRGNKLLYEMVRQTITDRVNKGIYKPDVALPSVQGFVAELGVSAITIRRALTDLQNAGLLRAVPGLGTFVNSSRRFVRHLNRVRDPLYGAFEEAAHIGRTATVQPLSVEFASPQDPVFSYFEISSGKHVCINKMVLIDGEAMALEHTFVTMPFDQDLVDELTKDLMYRVLRRRKFKLSKNRVYFDAAPASPEVAAHLGVPDGYPTIRHFYNPVIKGSRGLMIYGVSISPFDRLAYAADLAL